MLNGSKVKVSEQPICEDAVWVVVDPSIALGRITRHAEAGACLLSPEPKGQVGFEPENKRLSDFGGRAHNRINAEIYGSPPWTFRTFAACTSPCSNQI